MSSVKITKNSVRIFLEGNFATSLFSNDTLFCVSIRWFICERRRLPLEKNRAAKSLPFFNPKSNFDTMVGGAMVLVSNLKVSNYRINLQKNWLLNLKQKLKMPVYDVFWRYFYARAPAAAHARERKLCEGDDWLIEWAQSHGCWTTCEEGWGLPKTKTYPIDLWRLFMAKSKANRRICMLS